MRFFFANKQEYRKRGRGGGPVVYDAPRSLEPLSECVARDGDEADKGRTRANEGMECRQFFAPETGRTHVRFPKNGDTIDQQ